jgi:hypothetical protein
MTNLTINEARVGAIDNKCATRAESGERVSEMG